MSPLEMRKFRVLEFIKAHGINSAGNSSKADIESAAHFIMKYLDSVSNRSFQ
jgi:hypothetical protein